RSPGRWRAGAGAREALGHDGCVRGQALSRAIEPGRADAHLLGSEHVPHEVIAHHPRIAWMRSERFERVTIDARIGLAAAELALDHHDVEEAREVPADDLLALHARITVGDEPERDTSRPQALERGEGVGEERPRGASAVSEVGRHPRGQAVAEPAA